METECVPVFIWSATAEIRGIATQEDPDVTDKYLVSFRTPLLFNPRSQPTVRDAARMPPPLMAIPISLEVEPNPEKLGIYDKIVNNI